MTRVLVPVAVLKGGTVSPGLLNLLGTVDVTVLGYHVLPEQTTPDQARAQFEERATGVLESLAQEFRSAGGAADYRLVFTQSREQSISRVAEEIAARAFAISGVTGDVDSLLVALSGDIAVENVVGFVSELVGDRDIGVTLLVAGGDETAARERLDSAAGRIREAGIAVETMTATGPPRKALVDNAATHDAIVMGEQAPSLRSLVFGEEGKRVAEASVGPVIVVRRGDPPDATG